MFSELDDGTSFAILSEQDISKTNHFGLEFIEKVNEIPRKDFKRVKITRLSWIFIILSVIVTLLYFLM